MQTLLLVAVAIAVVAGVGVLVARDRPLLAEDPAGPPPLAWPPQGPIDPAALADVRFPVALRGYRMDQVDRVLDDAAAALAERDARIDQLVRVIEALGAPGPLGDDREPALSGDDREAGPLGDDREAGPSGDDREPPPSGDERGPALDVAQAAGGEAP
ncbi:MAG TPA: DivIVA domain-containing protein [Candidatus Nanopelagicales bacterium]